MLIDFYRFSAVNAAAVIFLESRSARLVALGKINTERPQFKHEGDF